MVWSLWSALCKQSCQRRLLFHILVLGEICKEPDGSLLPGRQTEELAPTLCQTLHTHFDLSVCEQVDVDRAAVLNSKVLFKRLKSSEPV